MHRQLKGSMSILRHQGDDACVPVVQEEALPPQPAVPPTYAERLMANTNKKLQQNAAPGAASTRPQPTAAPTTAAPPAAATPVVPSSPAKTPAPVQNNIPTTNGNHITENGCDLCLTRLIMQRIAVFCSTGLPLVLGRLSPLHCPVYYAT